MKTLHNGLSAPRRHTATALSKEHASIPAAPRSRIWASNYHERRSEQPRPVVLEQLARASRLRERDVHEAVLRLRRARRSRHSDDGHPNSNTSYVFAGDMNGDGVEQRPDLHPAGYVGDELLADSGQRGDPEWLHRRSGSRGVGCVHQPGSVPEQTSRRIRRAQRDCSCRWSSGWTSASAQDVFQGSAEGGTAVQVRLDITNFGNLLNQQLGRRSASHPDQHSDEPRGRSGWQVDVSARTGQQRLADHVVPDDDLQLGRLHVDAELPV